MRVISVRCGQNAGTLSRESLSTKSTESSPLSIITSNSRQKNTTLVVVLFCLSNSFIMYQLGALCSLSEIVFLSQVFVHLLCQIRFVFLLSTCYHSKSLVLLGFLLEIIVLRKSLFILIEDENGTSEMGIMDIK